MDSPHLGTNDDGTGAWYSDSMIRLPDGREVPRWGRAGDVMKILDLGSKDQVYDLIHTKQIRAFKPNPLKRANSPWRIDLLSVWKLKQRQLAES